MVLKLLPSALERLIEPDGRIGPIWYRFFFQQIKAAQVDKTALETSIDEVSGTIVDVRAEFAAADAAAVAAVTIAYQAYTDSAIGVSAASLTTSLTAAFQAADTTSAATITTAYQVYADAAVGAASASLTSSLTAAYQAADSAGAAAITTAYQAYTSAAVAASAAFLTTSISAAFAAADTATAASLTTAYQAYADAQNNAQAILITNLTSTVGGHTATITTQQSSINALKLTYGVSLSIDKDVVGFFRLDGGDTGSNMTFGVDTFRVTKRSTTGGDPVTAFEIGDVGGTPAITLRAPMIADEGIIARMIRAGAITADKIDVDELTAISAHFGNAAVDGIITSSNGKMVLDFDNGTIEITA